MLVDGECHGRLFYLSLCGLRSCLCLVSSLVELDGQRFVQKVLSTLASGNVWNLQCCGCILTSDWAGWWRISSEGERWVDC